MRDDQYAAAAEMYLTAFSRKDADLEGYRTVLMDSPHFAEASQLTWASTASAGTLSLLTAPNDLPAADVDRMKHKVTAFADQTLAIQSQEGYPVNLTGHVTYPWGSNSFVLNKLLFVAYAYDFSGDPKYIKSLFRTMDYLLGNNAMKLSYITGYGEFAETDTHDRWAAAKYEEGIPYPKGWVVGGPNNDAITDGATPQAMPAAKSYAPPDTGKDAYASKENTVNWNAPLVWVAHYAVERQADLGGQSAGGNADVKPKGWIVGGALAAAFALLLLAWRFLRRS
jgi:endoglucanase